MTNAERILARLDELLEQPVDITIYGRAALSMGFEVSKEEYALSLDVDAVLWMGQAEELEENGNFWNALDQVNKEFQTSGLYMSHLFEERQVFLQPDWRANRIAIRNDFRKLALFRLSDGDLLLSKMMRYDPVDLDDLTFIIDASGLKPAQVSAVIHRGRLPESEEVHEQMALCHAWLISQGLCLPD